MEESKSTDKLLALTYLISNIFDKIPNDKIANIKSLKIDWETNDDEGYELDHPLPNLNIEFHK